MAINLIYKSVSRCCLAITVIVCRLRSVLYCISRLVYNPPHHPLRNAFRWVSFPCSSLALSLRCFSAANCGTATTSTQWSSSLGPPHKRLGAAVPPFCGLPAHNVLHHPAPLSHSLILLRLSQSHLGV